MLLNSHLIDHEVDSSSIPMDYSLRSCLLDTQFEVRIHHYRKKVLHLVLPAIFLKLLHRCWTDGWSYALFLQLILFRYRVLYGRFPFQRSLTYLCFRLSSMTGWIEVRLRRESLCPRRLGVCSIFCMDIWVCLEIYCSGAVLTYNHGLDASEFLRKHPWPGRAIADTFDDSNHRHGNISKRILSTLNIMCGKTGDGDELYDEADYEDERVLFDATESGDTERPFYWTQSLQQNFRQELEKYVICDSNS